MSWILQSGDAEQEIAARAVERGADGALAREHLGIGALAARDYAGAERHFVAALAAGAEQARLDPLRALAREAVSAAGSR